MLRYAFGRQRNLPEGIEFLAQTADGPPSSAPIRVKLYDVKLEICCQRYSPLHSLGADCESDGAPAVRDDIVRPAERLADDRSLHEIVVARNDVSVSIGDERARLLVNTATNKWRPPSSRCNCP